jgi:hypothetical protein
MHTSGFCHVDLTINQQKYPNQKLHILQNLCVRVVLGRDFMSQYKSVQFNFSGDRKRLEIFVLDTMLITPVRSFKNVSPNIRPAGTQNKTMISSMKKSGIY